MKTQEEIYEYLDKLIEGYKLMITPLVVDEETDTFRCIELQRDTKAIQVNKINLITDILGISYDTTPFLSKANSHWERHSFTYADYTFFDVELIDEEDKDEYSETDGSGMD